MTLDQKKGERAALVKGSQGDWAVVKAQWKKFRRGVPPHKAGAQKPVYKTHLFGPRNDFKSRGGVCLTG